jgi:hypothetical protein
MAATVQIHELNGAGPTGTDKSSGTIRLKMTDNATVDLNDPLVVPPSGIAYSMQKWLRLRVTAGPFTQISNIRAYTDGANGYGTGIELFAKTAANYATPAVPSTSDDPPHLSGVDMVDAFSYTIGSPLDMDALNAGPFDSTGLPKYIGDHMVLVMKVASTASQGLKTAETITIAFDEI